MIALFVTTETREPGPAPMRSSASLSAASSAARVAEISAVGGLPLDELHQPVDVAVAVPEEALDPLEQARGETPEPLLRAELEDAVGLEARLLRAAPVSLRQRRSARDRASRR